MRKRTKDFYWKTELEYVENEDGTMTTRPRRVKVEVNQMRILTLSKKIDAIYDKLAIKSADDPIFKRYGIQKNDALEQICAVMDTLRSFVNRSDVGWGHTVEYFKKEKNRQHEWLAHCFENAFLGNRCFQLLMPVEYQEMIDYIRTLKEP